MATLSCGCVSSIYPTYFGILGSYHVVPFKCIRHRRHHDFHRLFDIPESRAVYVRLLCFNSLIVADITLQDLWNLEAHAS